MAYRGTYLCRSMRCKHMWQKLLIFGVHQIDPRLSGWILLCIPSTLKNLYNNTIYLTTMWWEERGICYLILRLCRFYFTVQVSYGKLFHFTVVICFSSNSALILTSGLGIKFNTQSECVLNGLSYFYWLRLYILQLCCSTKSKGIWYNIFIIFLVFIIV